MVKAIMDDSEQQFLEANIQAALAQKEITLADAIDVRKLAENNVDYASYMLSSRIDKRTRAAAQQAAQNSQDNTQAAIQAAQAKSQGDIQLEQVKAQLKSVEMTQQQEYLRELEILKSVNIIKSEIAKSMMAQPGATWQQLPPTILDGMGIVDQSEKQLMVHAIHEEQDLIAQQQQGEQAMAQQQQGQPEQAQQPQEQAA